MDEDEMGENQVRWSSGHFVHLIGFCGRVAIGVKAR